MSHTAPPHGMGDLLSSPGADSRATHPASSKPLKNVEEAPLLSRLFLRVVHFTILIIVTIRMTKKLMDFGFTAYLQDFLPCSRWDVTI